MSDEFAQFNAAFFEESAEHVSAIEKGLLELEQRPSDLELLNTIFRSAHSIKGVAGMLGFAAVAQFTHKMETLLDQLRNGRITVTPPLTDVLLRATDYLKTLLDAAQSERSSDEAIAHGLEAQLEAFAMGSPLVVADVSSPLLPSPLERGPVLICAEGGQGDRALPPRRCFDISWTPPSFLFQRGLDPQKIFTDLGDLGIVTDVRMDRSRLPDLVSMDPEQCYLAWTVRLETDQAINEIESVFEFVRDDSVLTIEECAPSCESRLDAPHAPKRIGEILVESGAVTQDALNLALAQQKQIGEILIAQQVVTPTQLAQALETQRQTAPVAQTKKADPATIRVDTAKIDKLINLVGELVITQSMLSDLGARFDMTQLALLLERMTQLEHNTRELQEQVMGIRMLPIGTVFSRFPRLVRDLAGKNGKKMQLVISGEETELDKTVIESIGDPLTHLIRNSADHGLESPEERLAAGKPEQGAIRLTAFHEGGSICIAIEDDGRGLPREKILAKAVKQGLLREDENVSDDHVWALVFQPGFSTADKVTDVSGRGVGMDVVKRNIEALGGTVAIQTTAGKGTRFVLTLPLTLAIIDGLSVTVGGEIFIVPLTTINKSVQPTASELKTIVGKGELVRDRDEYLPIVRLSEVFGVGAAITDPTKAILMILESQEERVAVMVDAIIGQQQVVIKSLEQNFRKVDGVAGATILGDGTVAFILDVRGLLQVALRGDAVGA